LQQLIKVIVLGLIQGITEWLPISSTGHLKIFEHILDLTVPIVFDVILHVGTLIVVLVFFRKELGKILSATAHLDFKNEDGKMVPLIIVGVVPTILIGLVFGWLIEDVFQTILPIALAFLVCGLVLYSSRIGKEKTDSINYPTAIMMGIVQGIAIVPGISRSGVTIAIALLLGIKREKAFEFSFLLSIPAILGALCLTLYTEFGKLTAANLGFGEIIMGAVVSMLVGYLALKLLWKTLAIEKFYLFAFYCWLFGLALIMLG